ncbi:hypothetical protein NDU88_002289 [Pleurodeles waltl]|uniref:Uncharacterized protein n=1 Tax=Pleurodeles waltl TaxID=8319 RepID=A0AAV7UY92_PLEWA|nr:hypothetical protein NDU88_002289 [Pleurodeles waltl]
MAAAPYLHERPPGFSACREPKDLPLRHPPKAGEEASAVPLAQNQVQSGRPGGSGPHDKELRLYQAQQNECPTAGTR